MAGLQTQGAEIRRQDRSMIYDTLYIPATTSWAGDQTFFLNNANKKLSETNLKTAGMFENGNSFLCQGLSLASQSYVEADHKVLAEIIEKSAFLFQIGDSDYLKGPARMIAGHLRTNSLAVAFTGTNRDNIYKLDGDNAVGIKPMQTFRLVLRVETSIATMSVETGVMAILHGLFRKPAQ